MFNMSGCLSNALVKIRWCKTIFSWLLCRRNCKKTKLHEATSTTVHPAAHPVMASKMFCSVIFRPQRRCFHSCPLTNSIPCSSKPPTRTLLSGYNLISHDKVYSLSGFRISLELDLGQTWVEHQNETQLPLVLKLPKDSVIQSCASQTNISTQDKHWYTSVQNVT